jgi:sugar (pentulose or hexulose) kinase
MGTSWCKAGFVDPQGRIVAQSRAFVRDIVPSGDGRTALDGQWQALARVVRAASAQLDPLERQAGPAAIGTSIRSMHGVFLDERDQPFAPPDDARQVRGSETLAEVYALPGWGAEGPWAYGYATRLVAVLHWLRHQDPAAWRRIRRAGSLRDLVAWRMTGRWVTDPTTGPGCLTWPDGLPDMTGLPLDTFPEVAPVEAIVGALSEAAADDLGLPAATPVVTGLHDGPAANLGTGMIEPGDVTLTLGTNFVFRAVNGPHLPDCFGYVILPDRWAWVNNVPSAAPQLDVVASEVTGIPVAAVDHGGLAAHAALVAPGSGGLVFERFRYGEQERQREQVRQARASGHPDAAIYRAMMEAIGRGERWLYEWSFRDGTRPRRYVATGGCARNGELLRIIAASLNAPLGVGHPEAGLLGAALVAGTGAGWYASVPDAVAAAIRTDHRVEPDPETVEVYRELYARLEAPRHC